MGRRGGRQWAIERVEQRYGTHLVGERAFHSGGRAIADIPLKVVRPRRDCRHFGLRLGLQHHYPGNDHQHVKVKPGDILIINTGYHRYSWDQPQVNNPEAQGGLRIHGIWISRASSGSLAIEFFKWALEMKLKVIGVDCGAAEHPMNTPILRECTSTTSSWPRRS